MVRYLAASLAVLSCVLPAHAQVASVANGAGADAPHTSSSLFTLQQALALSGAASAVTDVAQANLRAAQASRTVAGLRPNPSLLLEAENVAGGGLYRDTQRMESSASLSLPLEMGGKRSARIAVADARTGRAHIEAAILHADLRLAVTLAYAEAAAAERNLIVAREQARIAEEMHRAASIRVKAGRASPLEVQRADVTRINADATVRRAGKMVNVTRAALATHIGQDFSGTLDQNWFRTIEMMAGKEIAGPAEILNSADTLAYAAAQADISIADASVRLARSYRIPDVTISAGARRFEETGDTAALLSLSVPLPVMNSGKAALAQAHAERQSAEARRRLAIREVNQAITRAQADVANAAISAQAATGPALSAAEEAARIARIGYREGKFGQLDLLEAERTLAETRQAAIDALLSYHSAGAQLARLTARAPSDQE